MRRQCCEKEEIFLPTGNITQKLWSDLDLQSPGQKKYASYVSKLYSTIDPGDGTRSEPENSAHTVS